MANIDYPISRNQPNLLHILPAYVDKDKKIINGLVEVNSETINKYEFLTETGHLKLDRVGYSSLAYPIAYGAIPTTFDQDGDLLDFMIAGVKEKLVPGCLVELRVIGIMKFEDGGERDDKVICVLKDDKRMDHIDSYEYFGEHWRKEVEHYFEHYKDLKKPGTCKVLGFYDTDEALKIIDECMERYDTEIRPKVS